MNESFLQAIKEDFPDIEYNLLFQDFLQTVNEWKPEWYGVIIAGPDDMQWWHEKQLPGSRDDLWDWYQIYKNNHPNVRGYVFRKGKVETDRVASFFSNVYHNMKG